ncbi:MAG TPA: C13 family peptidase [Burkholderiales bacterium]|nr:C13 family peptidase [Burkholderiales bacterium]
MKRALALLLLVLSLAALAAPSGPPDVTWPDGSKYWGALRFNRPNGYGHLTGPDGRSYEGDFADGKFHGRGHMKLPNGDEYVGGFQQGLYEGEGTLKYASPRADGKTQDTGVWRQGKLVTAAERERAAAERERFALNVETALYRQRPLLDAALAGIEPSAPGKINLYLLAIGGDGSQEVFRREVEFVRAQFDRDFGTRGRSVALVNSRTTVATMPMATATNIREAIKAIAARMDRENDILFLFMTSHGAKDHEFRLNQNAMTLRGLRPRELASMLEESRIRWKVVLVSACYSGGFVEPLKSDTTMVITAARADRTSFGCEDENDFTYFGRAFFKEALPASASFQDAFGRAQVLVGEWEKKDKTSEAERSLPQMHSARPIADQLARWWAQPRR